MSSVDCREFGGPCDPPCEPCIGPPKPYWSEQYRCWYVPVASELLSQGTRVVEPVRLEFKDGQLWITQLEADKT